MCQALYSRIVEICARAPVHAAQGARPHGEHQVAGGAQKSLVHQELVVAVLVQAFQPGPVTPHAVHARRRVAREFDPFRLQRMKLRMDHGPGKWNLAPAEPSKRPATRPDWIRV